MPGHVLASGGFALGTALDDLILELSGPRVCFVPTASRVPDDVGQFYLGGGDVIRHALVRRILEAYERTTDDEEAARSGRAGRA